jgi:hypothetical protein
MQYVVIVVRSVVPHWYDTATATHTVCTMLHCCPSVQAMLHRSSPLDLWLLPMQA